MKGPDTRSTWLRENFAEWHTAGPSDVEALYQLVSEIEAFDNPPYRTTLAEVRGWLSGSGRVAATIGLAADGPLRGKPVCYALVNGVEGESECLAQGGVAPPYRGRGLGAAVVLWQVQRGTELLPSGGRILTHVSGDKEELQGHLTRMGFTWIRTSYEVRRSLSDIPPLPELSWGLDVEPWSEDWDAAARRLYVRLVDNAAGGDEWKMGTDSVRPEWSFVALDRTGDRPDLAGFIRVSAYEQDWDALGWKEGYIDLLGVEDGRGSVQLSRALVIRSMQAMALGGMDKVATGVGGGSNEAAVGFYEELGFQRSFNTKTYSYQV